RKQRPNGPVDEPAGQGFFRGGPTFALDKPAGKLARGVGFFAVIDDQGKEIAPFVGLAFDGGNERYRVAILHDDGAMRLLGQLTGFNTQLARTEGTFDSTCLHGTFLTLPAGRAVQREEKRQAPAKRLGAPGITCADRAGSESPDSGPGLDCEGS